MRAIPVKALIAVLLALGLQVAFWSQTRDLRAGWEGVPPVPSPKVALALALGDRQFLYRASAFTLQNMGDEGGRVTPLRDYDYRRLGRWFRLLDGFDAESEYLPFLVGYYFSQSTDKEDVRVVIGYLARIAMRDPERNWRWLMHAVYLARHRVKDTRLALDPAYRAAALDAPGIPLWTKQMPAFVLAEIGEKEAARDLFEALLESDSSIPPEEMEFMQGYIDRRLK